MRGVLVVAAREVTERRTILLASLVAGLIPFVSPLLPGVRADQIGEARDALALVLAAAFGLGSSLLLGATVVGRDLAEGRLSFDFARPLGGGTIWAGRFAGALAVTLLATALVLFPTSAVGGGVFAAAFRRIVSVSLPVLLAGVLLLLPLAHAAGVAFRSRSGVLAADLACGTVVLLLCATAAKRLFDGFALDLLRVSAMFLLALGIFALWIASIVQVAVGRTDPRRGHRVLSMTLWGILLAVVLGFQAYTGWVVSADPSDLAEAAGIGSPRGDWAFASGSTPGRGDYHPSFLLDVSSGRFLRLGGDPMWGRNERFSADGRRAAWLHADGPRNLRVEVMVADLQSPQPRARETRISFPNPWVEIALAADGGRLAAVHEKTLSVFDVDTGKTLAAVLLPFADAQIWRLDVAFAGPDRVKVIRIDGGKLSLVELDVQERQLGPVVEATVEAELPRPSWSPKRDRLLVRDLQGRQGAWLLDGSDGSILAALAPSGAAARSSRFLADGRIVVAESESGTVRLVVYSPDGVESKRIDLGRFGLARLVGEGAPGEILVAVRSAPAGPAADGARIVAASIDSGTVREVASGLNPLSAFWGIDAATDASEPGSAATTLFVRSSAIVRLDPRTGEERTVAGRPRG